MSRKTSLLLLLLTWCCCCCLATIHFQQQRVCNNTNTDLFPSWCNKQNPFTIPFLFSDNEFPEETKEVLCNGVDPLSECTSVVKIKTIEMKHPDLPDPIPYILFALKSGKMIVVAFNYDIVAVVQKQQNDTIEFMDGARAIDDPLGGQILAASEHVVHFYYGSVNDKDPFRLYKRQEYDTSQTIKDVRIVLGFNETFGLVYMFNSNMKVYQMMFYKLYKLEAPTYTLYPFNNTFIQYGPFMQHGNYTIGAMTSAAAKASRVLFLLYSNSQAKIITFVKQDLEIYFDDLPRIENVYTNAAKQISTAYVMVEKLRRVFISKSNCTHVEAPPSESINLMVTLTDDATKQSTLEFRNMPEFANYSFASPAPDPFNPANKVINCPNQYYDYDTGKCQDVQKYSFSLGTYTPILMKERFVDLPSQVDGIRKLIDDYINPAAICELMKNRFPVFYRECYDMFLNGTSCDVDLFKKASDLILDNLMTRFLYSVVFIATKEKKILVFGAQQKLDTATELLIDKFNELSFLGQIKDLELSYNGQHLFVPVTRRLFELQAISRYEEICNTLNRDPDNLFLKAYRDACITTPPRKINLNQYAQYVSSCQSGVYCPSLTHNQISQVQDGYFTLRPNVLNRCPPGYFCRSGVRINCPQGFYCPDEQMTIPRKCDFDSYNTTCFKEQTVYPQIAPQGTISIAPYAPPFPIAPGYFLSPVSRTIQQCPLGTWCSLGRFSPTDNITSLLCPSNTFCSSPDVLTPKICNCSAETCSYCPAGSYQQRPCDAGFYCMGPDNRIPCAKTYYCPNGTTIPQLCPAGYYCPQPSNKIICPAFYFCKEGSVLPTRCPTLALCPEGTQSDQSNFMGLVIDLSLIIAVIAIVTFLIQVRRYRQRKAAEKRKLKYEKEKLDQLNVQSTENHPLIPQNKLRQKRFKMHIKFEKLGLELKKGGARVLDSVSGELENGKLTAIMGVSGSGKSTFLSTLSGRAKTYGNISGKVYINGKEASLTNYNQVVGFVPQDDIMHRTMTVEETLYFSARTRLDYRTPKAEINDIVDRVIKVLKLEDVRHSEIGDESKRGISGGQRKRVNIGMELVADPCVLFLDEPTSGLDSSASREVCEALRQIADSGITVITVIHQPRYEIFQMFHDVLLLGKGGRTCYLGPCKDAIPYFQNLGFQLPDNVNPADYLLDVINGDIQRQGHNDFHPSDLPKLWEQRKTQDQEWEVIDAMQLDDIDYNPAFQQRSTLFIYQLWSCLKRALVQHYLRDLSGFFLDMVLVYLSGLFLGMIFFSQQFRGPPPSQVINMCPGDIRKICELPIDDPIISLASLTPLSLGLTAVMAALPTFGKEDVIYTREFQSGLSPLAYFLGKNIAQLPNIALAPLIFLSIFFTLYSPRGSIFGYYYILFLMHFTAYGVGYFVSIVVRSSLAQLAGVVLLLQLQLFSGARPTLPQLSKMFFPIPYIPYISYIRWGQEALYLNEIVNYKEIYDISTALTLFNYKESDYLMCVILVVVFGIAIRAMCYIALLCNRPDSYFQLMLNYVTDWQGHLRKLKALCCCIYGCIIKKRQVQDN